MTSFLLTRSLTLDLEVRPMDTPGQSCPQEGSGCQAIREWLPLSLHWLRGVPKAVVRVNQLDRTHTQAEVSVEGHRKNVKPTLPPGAHNQVNK